MFITCIVVLAPCCHLSLVVLERSHEFTNLQKVKLAASYHRASYMYTASVEGWGPELLHAKHYVLWAKIILADFNLVVSTPTAKLPNLVPCQIF